MPVTDLVIFDMDGVLADTEPLHLAAANRALADDGIVLDEAGVARFLGRTDLAMFEVLADECGLARPPWHYVARKGAAFLARLAEEPLLPNPGVMELLLGLRMRGLDCVVASSSPPATITAIVEALGLSSSFSRLFSASEVARGKPAPDLFLHAAATRGVDPGSCLVIEDAPNGIAAARAAGMRVVAVRTATTAGLDLEGADAVLDSLLDLDCEEWFDGR
jgi:HAD superfamily hydrolase (TIGR01509 family)